MACIQAYAPQLKRSLSSLSLLLEAAFFFSACCLAFASCAEYALRIGEAIRGVYPSSWSWTTNISEEELLSFAACSRAWRSSGLIAFLRESGL